MLSLSAWLFVYGCYLSVNHITLYWLETYLSLLGIDLDHQQLRSHVFGSESKGGISLIGMAGRIVGNRPRAHSPISLRYVSIVKTVDVHNPLVTLYSSSIKAVLFNW